jgi:hypothetical protein
LSRLYQFASDDIGIDYGNAETGKTFGYSALT